MPNLIFVQGKKGVWIRLPIERVNLVEAAVKITYDILGRSELQEGFWYHHAESDYLMLVYWIPQSPHTLPTNSTHRVGTGAFLINQNREVLVVQEKGGQYRGTGVWKLPTGVDEGEDIFAAAVREIDSELWKFSHSDRVTSRSLRSQIYSFCACYDRSLL
ncbi:hypothetical protein ACFX15_036472 [Malus domestica]